MILDARFSAERLGCERVHSHAYSVVAAVESGTIEMSIADQLAFLDNGVICVIPEGVNHQILSTSEDFSGVHVLSLACSILLSSGRKATTGILTKDQEWYLQFLNFMRDYDDTDDGSKTMLYRSIMLLLGRRDIHLSDELDKQNMASVHWVPTKIKDLIDRGTGMEKCFQYIEEDMPFSKEHCNRLFKKCYGTTIQSYCLDVRTEKARLLLKSGLPLAQSATEAGFYDQSQLTKAFRSVFQMTPAEYQKQTRRNSNQSDTRNF